MKKLCEYAAYRGEEFLDIGTAKYLAEKYGYKLKTIYWFATCNRFKKHKKHSRSLELYRIEED